MSLRSITSGAAAMSLVNVLRLLAQFFALPLLARRLSLSDYGVVGMALPFLAFTMMIADTGLGLSLIRSAASNRRVWSTCFWLSVLLGIGLATVLVALAPLASFMFHEPRLGPIIATLGLVVLAETATTIPMTMLQQKSRFHVISAIEIVAVLSGIGTAVITALHGGGAWALVGQQLTYFTVRLAATAIVSPFRPLMILDLPDAREHLAFGRDFLGVNFVAFFSRSADNLVIGKAIGAAAVGVYGMTCQFIRLPLLLVTGPLQYVLYSQLSGIQDDKIALRRLFLILTRGLAVLGFPLIGMVAAAHDPLFKLLLSEKWAVSGELFMILAPVSALQQLTALSGTIALVLGRTDIQLRTSAEFGIIWLAALLTSVWFGLQWTAGAYTCAVILYTPRSLMFGLRLLQCSALLYASVLAIPTLVTFACIAAFWELSRLLSWGGWAQLYGAAAFFIVGVVVSALGQRRAFLEEFGRWQRWGTRAETRDPASLSKLSPAP
jgi:O-antigen/teichoic acid export membrane protein